MSSEKSPNQGEMNASVLPSPVYNIHIHSSDSTIYIPPIQPIFHIHIEKAVNTDVTLIENDEELAPEMSENLPPMKTSEFKNDACQTRIRSRRQSLRKTNENNRTPSSKRCLCNDSQPSRERRREMSHSNDSVKRKINYNSRNNKTETSETEHDGISNITQPSECEDFKLRKAVVVLEDILKGNPKYQKKYEPPKDSSEKLKNYEEEDEKLSIKQEYVSQSPVGEEFDGSCFSENVFENDQVQMDEVRISTPTIQGIPIKDSVTVIAESYNFSEILGMFKIKSDGKITVEQPKNGNSDDKWSIEYLNETIPDSIGEENVINCTSECDIIDSNEYKNDLGDSIHKTDDNYVQIEVRQCSDSKFKQDKLIASGNQLGSEEIFVDSVLNDSSTTVDCCKSGDNLGVSERNNSSINDVGDVNFQLQLIKKEMQRRSILRAVRSKNIKTREKSDKDSVKSESSSPPKKMKHSDKVTEKKEKSSPGLDYIPLNASGPTKFSVAPLDSINPYETHSAKNFKQEMLFGNRVARFNSSEQQRINQLKYDAALKSIKN